MKCVREAVESVVVRRQDVAEIQWQSASRVFQVRENLLAFEIDHKSCD